MLVTMLPSPGGKFLRSEAAYTSKGHPGWSLLRRIGAARHPSLGRVDGIGWRLLVRVLLFSSAITLLLTLMQLYLDYRRDVQAIDQRMSEIESGYRQSLGEGLWRMDQRQLQSQLDGILRLPDIRYVELREATNQPGGLVVTAGARQATPPVRSEFRISYTNRGIERLLGFLMVEASYEQVYRRLFDTAAFILVGRAIETFIVSFFILFIVHQMVTRDLIAMATAFRKYDVRGSHTPLRLKRRRPRRPDELDDLVGAFNQMYERLQAAYADLQVQVGLLQLLPVSAWTLKPDGTPDFVNQVWLDFAGQELDFVRSHPEAWMAAVHPEDREVAARIFWEGVHSGQGFNMEIRSLRAQDGTYRWHLIQCVVLRDSEGKILKFVGTTTDIDDQKRTEEALRVGENNLRQITETIPEMLWSASSDGGIDYCNGRLLDYTGFSLEQVKSDGWMNLLHPDDVVPTAEIWRSCVKSGAPYRVEVRTVHAADRTYRWCVTRALPLLDQEGRIVKWHGTVVDMHDWKQAQEELRQAQGDLAHINRVTTLGELAASVAHEVNQPITGAVINASVCLRKLGHDKPDLEEVRVAAARMLRDAQRAAEIVGRIRAQFEKGISSRQLVDLNEIIRETFALLRGEATRYNISVRTELAADLPCIIGDRVQLQQVIMNLIVNSIEAMKDVDGTREIVITSRQGENKQILLAFCDTGMGFAPQLAEQIFEPFYTTKPHGTGMGLRISRSIIESHSGRMWAESAEGNGATFHINLPAVLRVDRGIQPAPTIGTENPEQAS